MGGGGGRPPASPSLSLGWGDRRTGHVSEKRSMSKLYEGLESRKMGRYMILLGPTGFHLARATFISIFFYFAVIRPQRTYSLNLVDCR